jgi:hypothetical protein
MQLLSVLLLTVSNVMFVPAIGLAVVRRFFTEAVMYSATMTFSTVSNNELTTHHLYSSLVACSQTPIHPNEERKLALDAMKFQILS